MDPESIAFQPRDDFWQFQNEMIRVQQTQADLSDRVSRLERKQEDDSRLKNVWGTSSPFPSVLGGTPQQVPLQQPIAEHFSSFDDHSSNLIGNLQLDTDEEPRRVGATSRANSVRFDETANHGHWAHASRSSLDLIPRTGSGLGGHLMSERSYSHKSDGRQSSAGHSVHSVTSGRANSLIGFGPVLPIEPPGLAPGLFILGSVPAIIRCWLNTNFKHDTLLYAAICTGSYTSYLSMRLIEHLGYQEQLILKDDGTRKVKLPVFLPEAVPVSASSRSNSPAPQLPSIEVEFTVMKDDDSEQNHKAIQIFLGSDVLRAHNADVLFSSSQLTLYDDDRSKLQIPLVRPEDDQTFKYLFVSNGVRAPAHHVTSSPFPSSSQSGVLSERSSRLAGGEPGLSGNKMNDTSTTNSSDESSSVGRRSLEQRPYLSLSTGRNDSAEAHDSSSAIESSRAGTSPAIWSNWRKDQSEKANTGSLDWTNVGKTTASNPNYQRRDTGIKVLKPSKPSRTLSTSTSSPITGQSRFFDEGKTRGENEYAVAGAPPQGKRTVSGEKVAKENAPALLKPRSANPIGGASAFAWLNNGGSKRN